MEDSASPLDFGRAPVSPSSVESSLSSEPPPLSGVDGNIKQAFGDRATSRNLRDDLLLAADNVTSAMSSLVRELNSGTCLFNKLASVFYASTLLLIMNFVITLSK